MDKDTLPVHVVNLAQQKGQVFTETAMMKVLADRQQHLSLIDPATASTGPRLS